MSDEKKGEGSQQSSEPKAEDTHGGSKKDGSTAGGGHVNPSAPEDANTTPGTTGEK